MKVNESKPKQSLLSVGHTIAESTKKPDAKNRVSKVKETVMSGIYAIKDRFMTKQKPVESFNRFIGAPGDVSSSGKTTNPTPQTSELHSLPKTDLANRPDISKEFTAFETPKADNEGMARYPSKVISMLTGIDQKNITMTEKKMLDGLSFTDKFKFWRIKEDAEKFAERFSKNNELGLENGPGDAFRHAFWNASMTRQFGADWTKQYTDAHEALKGNPKTKAFMDMWNNKLGIKIAQENPNASQAEMATLIAEAVRNGDAVIIDPLNQTPIYSDQHAAINEFRNPSTEYFE